MKVRSIKKKTINRKSVLSEAKIKHPAFFMSFYSSPIAKALLDLDTHKYIEVNNTFIKLFECKRTYVLNKTPEKLGFIMENAETKEVLKNYRKERFRTFNFNIKSFKGNIKNVIITTEKIKLLEKDYLLGYIIDNTEKAEFEKKLEDSEHKYSIVLNNTQNVIYEYNLIDDRYNYISPSANELFGIPAETFLKKKNNIITPLLSLSDRRLFKDHFRMLRSSKGKIRKNFYVEYRIKDKQKNEKWLSDSHTVIYNKSGSAESIIGNITDISAKKSAQEELIQSYKQQEKYLEQLTAIQDSLPANIALIDKNGKILAVNNAWKSFAGENGLNCDSYCVGKNYLAVCKSSRGPFAEGSIEVYDGMKKVLQGKQREFQMEYPCHSKTEKRWFRFNISRISSKSNSGAVVMHVNITPQKLAEQSIKQSEDQYKLLFYNNPLPMWIFDFDSLRFIAVNDAAIKHYGYSKDEFLKMKLTDIRPKSELSKFMKYRKELIGNRAQHNSNNAGIWKHKKKNGEIIDVEVTRSPVVFEGKKAVLILANDVTENLSAEAALLKRNREISELYRAANELSRTLDSHKIYNSIYRIIRKLMPCDSMLISSYDKRNNSISCKAAWIGRKRLDISEFPVIPVDFNGGGLQSRVIKTGKSELLLNFQETVKQTGRKFYYKPDGTVNNKPNEKNKSENSAIVVPLKLKDAVIGVIQVKSLEHNAYTESDLMLVESLAAQISVSTSNAELYQRAQTEIRIRKETESQLLKTSLEISNIYEISKDLSDALTTEEINRKIFKKINATFPECDIGISIFDEIKGLIILRGLFTNGKEVDTSGLPPIVYDTTGKGLQSSVILTRKTRLVENYKSYLNKKNAKFYIKDDGTVTYEKNDITDFAESAVIVPLIYENRIIGTLQLLNYSNSGFSEGTIKMLETLASHIAVSFVNAELHTKVQNELNEKLAAEKELQAKTEELQILYDAQQVLSGSLEIENIYDTTYKIISSKLAGDSMIISSYDEEEQKIHIISVWTNGVKPDIKGLPPVPLAPEGRGIQSEVIRTGKTLLIENYKEHFRKTVTSYSNTNNVIHKTDDPLYNSAIIVPMKHDNKIIGVIQLLSYKEKAYNEANMKLLESLSGSISAATFNASLYRQAKTEIAEKQKAREELALRNKEITLLYSAGRELLSTLNLEEIYEILYKKVIDIIPCDSMIISEYDKKRGEVFCKAAWVLNTKHDAKSFPRLKIGTNYKGTQVEAIITGSPLIVNDFYEVIKDRKDKYYFDEEGNVKDYENPESGINLEDPVVRSAMYIPMKIGRNVIGVISVFSYKDNAYSEYDLKILESISVHLSVAAANAELYKRAQSEIAERIKKEEELKQIRKNLENAQRIAHIGSWVYNKRVNKIFNSSELYRILGITNEPESFDFDEGMSHIHTDDREVTKEKLKKAIEERASYQNEDRIIRPNGEIRFVKIVGEPMYDEHGVFIGMQGTLQDITEIKRINDELLKSLNEKELILKEIHHRVKNNLQVVSSLLRLQAESIEDKAAIGYLKMSEQRVKSMALIHQQLYRTKDLSRIDFREYIEDLCNYLFFSYDISFSRVSLQIEVDEIYFGIDTALPCGLIINELVTNAIKHAFPDYSVGSLTVKLQRMATGKYNLTVKDDGKGANKMDFEKTSTLGMELVKTLTEQLEGEIKLDVESGTEITISFFDQNKE
jgi:PAS domain S-box-containing protein